MKFVTIVTFINGLSDFNVLYLIKQLHTFPEGKVCQEDEPIRRLKWGTASLIARAPVTPIVLPIIHHGFEKVISYIFCSVFQLFLIEVIIPKQ